MLLALRRSVVVAALLAPASAYALEVPLPKATGFEEAALDVGGFMAPRFTFIQPDEEHGSLGELGFSVRRARFEASGKFRTGAFALKTDFSLEMMPEPSLRDAYAQVSLGKLIGLRLGQFKAPFARSPLTSDRRTLFPERATVSTYFTDREMGAQLGGSVGANHVEWQVGVFDGEGGNRLSNVNQKFMYAGRVVVSPLGGPPTGDELYAPDANEGRPAFALGYSFRYNTKGSEGEEEANLAHNAELFFTWRWVTAQGEWMLATTKYEAPAIADYDTTGWYGQIGSYIPGIPWAEEHVALAVRYEQGDLYEPIQVDVPLAGPTDPAQKHRKIGLGAQVYLGAPLLESPHDIRVGVFYNIISELEDQTFDNDELVVATHFAF